MKKVIVLSLVLLLSTTVFAQEDNILTITDEQGNEIRCNWGELTSTVIVEDGFDQGGHASSFPTPRVGLANVIARGDMEALCRFLSDITL